MTIYVLTSTYVCVDDGSYENRIDGVYEDFEQAQKQMEQEIRDAKIDFKDYDTEEEDYVDGDMSWSIWVDGEYMSHHCDIQITECEIQKS